MLQKDFAIRELASLLKVEEALLADLAAAHACRGGREVLEKVVNEIHSKSARVESLLGVRRPSAASVSAALRDAIFAQEKKFIAYLEKNVEGDTEFARAANFARQQASVQKGFFLKRSRGEEILKKRPPRHLMEFLGYNRVEQLLDNHDIAEIFSALRFMETTEWMHATFEEAYSSFTPDDFEEREIEVRVLGEEWHEVAVKFVEKKRHNVSHLKEFGVIFLNPIAEDVPGKRLRDFALLFHYLHEISFYAELFRHYAPRQDFAEKLKMLLRGDVREANELPQGDWMIVQRYLEKENPRDPRLFLPRVNPESVHWAKGEQDLVNFGKTHPETGLAMWEDLSWVGKRYGNGDEVVSFDMEDNAMTAVAFMEKKDKTYNYHQREALWTKLFCEYAGGAESMERELVSAFEKGIVSLAVPPSV